MTQTSATTGDLRVLRDTHGCLLLASSTWGTIVVAESDIDGLIADLEQERGNSTREES